MNDTAQAPTQKGRSHFTTIRGLRTHARVYGESHKEAIVVIPGLGCAAWMYRRIARTLSRWRQVWVYDPPGHGFSAGTLAYPAHIGQLTDHLALWMQANRLAGSPLLGHSLGGEVIIRPPAKVRDMQAWRCIHPLRGSVGVGTVDGDVDRRWTGSERFSSNG